MSGHTPWRELAHKPRDISRLNVDAIRSTATHLALALEEERLCGALQIPGEIELLGFVVPALCEYIKSSGDPLAKAVDAWLTAVEDGHAAEALDGTNEALRHALSHYLRPRDPQP